MVRGTELDRTGSNLPWHLHCWRAATMNACSAARPLFPQSQIKGDAATINLAESTALNPRPTERY